MVKPSDLDSQHVADGFPLAKHCQRRFDLWAGGSAASRRKLAAHQPENTLLEIARIAGDLRGKITPELVGKVADRGFQGFHDLTPEPPQTSLRFGSPWLGSWGELAWEVGGVAFTNTRAGRPFSNLGRPTCISRPQVWHRQMWSRSGRRKCICSRLCCLVQLSEQNRRCLPCRAAPQIMQFVRVGFLYSTGTPS